MPADVGIPDDVARLDPHQFAEMSTHELARRLLEAPDQVLSFAFCHDDGRMAVKDLMGVRIDLVRSPDSPDTVAEYVQIAVKPEGWASRP